MKNNNLKIDIAKYLLLELSTAQDIDSDEIEIYGEDEQGREGCTNQSIADIAKRALEAINLLQENEKEQDVIAVCKKSQLLIDGIPAFYLSKAGTTCTHRMDITDTPIWCKTGDDAMAAMDIINRAHSVPKQSYPGFD